LGWSLERNVEAGLRLASALIKFWEAHGYHGDGCEWLSQLLERPEGLARTLARAKALSVRGYLITEQGDFTHGRLLAEESLTLYRELGDKHGVAFGLFVLGYATCWHGDISTGRAIFAESLALYRELGDKLGITETLGNLGNWGDQQARSFMEESLALCRELGHLAGIGNRLTNLGLLASYQGDYASARPYLEEGLAIHRQLGERGAVFSLYYLGDLAFQQGNYEQARAYYEDSLALSKETGRNTVALWSYIQLGYVALRQDDAERARTLFEGSRTLFDNAGSSVIWVLEGWASLAVAEGQPERAMRLFAWADTMREKLHDHRPPVEQASVERDLAVIHSKLDDTEFSSLSAEGRAMTLEQAIALATEN
jgi:tetratricopeptide (TPR) repeat protein